MAACDDGDAEADLDDPAGDEVGGARGVRGAPSPRARASRRPRRPAWPWPRRRPRPARRASPPAPRSRAAPRRPALRARSTATTSGPWPRSSSINAFNTNHHRGCDLEGQAAHHRGRARQPRSLPTPRMLEDRDEQYADEEKKTGACSLI